MRGFCTERLGFKDVVTGVAKAAMVRVSPSCFWPMVKEVSES